MVNKTFKTSSEWNMKIYQRYYQQYHKEILVSEKPEHINGIICHVRSKGQSTETENKDARISKQEIKSYFKCTAHV